MRKSYNRGPMVSQSTERSGRRGTVKELEQGFLDCDPQMPETSSGMGDDGEWPEWDEANEETHRPLGHGGFLPRNSYRER